MRTSDEGLFARFKATGDRAAWVELRRRHTPHILKIVRLRFSDAETVKRIIRRAFRQLESRTIGDGDRAFSFAAYIAVCDAMARENALMPV